MKSYSYQTAGVCSKQINFSVDDAGKLHDVKFIGGCPGNLLAIENLLKAKTPKKLLTFYAAMIVADAVQVAPTSWQMLLTKLINFCG